MISIIIPTYNERANIAGLIEGIFRAGRRGKTGLIEVVVVDDNSPDGTAQAAKALSGKYKVKVLERPGKLGLASAVSDGFRATEGEIVGVMDADFSHPPEKIPELVNALENSDIAVGSRYVKGGGIENWPLPRRIMSSVAVLMARVLLGVRAKDPVSGFFFVRRDVLKKTKIDAVGYKILLDILVKNRGKRVVEVPYVFRDRKKGKSKLGGGEISNYLKTLWRLFRHG